MTVVVDPSTYVFTVNRNDVIRLAMTDCGCLGVGEEIAAEDLDYCADKLNMLVKQWQGTSDFAPGLKMWARKRADLFLETTKSSYLLGPSGDHWVTSGSWASAVTTAASAAAAVTLTVSAATVTDVVNGNTIGILLASGVAHWTTVSGTPTGTTITIAAALPSAAASGTKIFYYQTAAQRPLQILAAMVRDSNNHDTPLAAMTLNQYELVRAKADSNTTGTPAAYYYEAQLGNGRLYLNLFPANLATYPYLHVVYLSPIQDLVLSTDTPDYPQNWYRALAAQLAMDIAPGFQIPASKELIALRNDSVQIARNHDPDVTRLYFQPYADDYDGEYPDTRNF